MNTEADLSMRLTDTTGMVFWGPAERKSIHREILSVSITVTAGEKVSLTKPFVTIITKELQGPLELPITTIRRAAALISPSCEPPADSIYQAPNDVMERIPGTYHSRSVLDSVFVIELVVPDKPAEFSVQMSPLSIDGKITAVPSVHFVRKTKAQLIGAFSGSTIG